MHITGKLIAFLALFSQAQGKPEPESATAKDPAEFIGPRWPSIFEAPEFHMNIATKDVSDWLKQAGKDANEELSKAESPLLNSLGGFTEHALHRAARWTEQANEDLQRDPAGTLANSAWDAVQIGVFFKLGIVRGSVIRLLGFGGGGIGRGTLAAVIRSKIGNVAEGSVFSALQRAGAGAAE